MVTDREGVQQILCSRHKDISQRCDIVIQWIKPEVVVLGRNDDRHSIVDWFEHDVGCGRQDGAGFQRCIAATPAGPKTSHGER